MAIVTKTDLADAVEFNWDAAYGNIQAVRPGMRVFRLSSKTGQPEWKNIWNFWPLVWPKYDPQLRFERKFILPRCQPRFIFPME